MPSLGQIFPFTLLVARFDVIPRYFYVWMPRYHEAVRIGLQYFLLLLPVISNSHDFDLYANIIPVCQLLARVIA